MVWFDIALYGMVWLDIVQKGIFNKVVGYSAGSPATMVCYAAR